jgi:hypothetical protein
MESSCLFIFSNLMYVSAALTFYEGFPFRKEFYTNYLFLTNWIILFIFNFILAGINEARFLEFLIYGETF